MRIKFKKQKGLETKIHKVIMEEIEKMLEPEGEREDASSIVRSAIERTKDMPHFQKTFITRNPGPNSEGSTFKEPQTLESLAAANWSPYNHPEIKAPAMGYRADIPGMMNLVKLSEVEPETPIKMELGHKGETKFVTVLLSPKDLGQSGTPVDHTVILLGPGESGPIVWTFFPGDPVAPSTSTPNEKTRSAKTVRDAMALGFMYGKITGK